MRMRKVAIVGVIIAGLVLSGCSPPISAHDEGWNLIIVEDYQAARVHYENMLAEDPNDPYANLNLGVAHDELGNRDLAAKHYQVAIANGKGAEIHQITRDGKVGPRATTVSEIAQENLETLGS